MLNTIKVAAIALLIAGASTSAFAKSHKVHHQAPGYDSTTGVDSDGFGAKPWLGAPYDSQRQVPSEVSTFIF
jgi:hypothetical protein